MVRGWVLQKEHAEAEVYRLNEELQARVEGHNREFLEKADASAQAIVEPKQLGRLKSGSLSSGLPASG